VSDIEKQKKKDKINNKNKIKTVLFGLNKSEK
jgi:hypothetical protein